MINVEVTGTLPDINTNLEPAMEKIADIMFKSVQMNFISGGRPDQWAVLQPFGLPSHLGNMFESVQVQWDKNSATVFIDTARVPYAAIHNFGGVIKHPGSSKFQAFDYGGGMVFARGTKPHDIPIPKRQFMMFQEKDKEEILQVLSNVIFFQS